MLAASGLQGIPGLVRFLSDLAGAESAGEVVVSVVFFLALVGVIVLVLRLVRANP
ncbi:hypothetical protein [Xanthobacter sp.]|uniref:hypothetical protein n=1 Tax=Xanthobacter sp. TaxID=35809 RepID=UPI0025F1454B|nr:hypothetical protein [Xanthobacter sp.]